jgi:hypothetical protein
MTNGVFRRIQCLEENYLCSQEKIEALQRERLLLQQENQALRVQLSKAQNKSHVSITFRK